MQAIEQEVTEETESSGKALLRDFSAISASSALNDLVGLDPCRPCDPWFNLFGCSAKAKAGPLSGPALAHTH
ncbi:MAG: hypothetical protein C0518_10415 [Opitutus sp.]|nr:hypothetical protein [Opitutus sp.]